MIYKTLETKSVLISVIVFKFQFAKHCKES